MNADVKCGSGCVNSDSVYLPREKSVKCVALNKKHLNMSEKL